MVPSVHAQFPCRVWKLSFGIVLRAISISVLQQQVSVCRGRVWRPRTNLLCEPLNSTVGWVTHKARYLLHTSQPPNDSVLATCSGSHYTLFVWGCTADSWMTEAMWGHWDCTDLMLTQSCVSLLLVGGETTFHCLLLSCS